MEKRSEMSARQSIAIVAGPFEGNRRAGSRECRARSRRSRSGR